MQHDVADEPSLCINLFQGLAHVVDDHVVCLISTARSVFDGEWVSSEKRSEKWSEEWRWRAREENLRSAEASEKTERSES